MDFCLGKNKDADQLCSNCTADQRLCFCYMDSTILQIFLNPKFLSGYVTAQASLLDRVGTPGDLFSHVVGQIQLYTYGI